MFATDSDKECKSIAVFIQTNDSLDDSSEASSWMIGYVAVGAKTRWDALDRSVGELFKEYVKQVDPSSHLGLDEECLKQYRVGEVVRSLSDEDTANLPELLPCGYLVGDCNQIFLSAKTNAKDPVPAALSLDTLIPLPILDRYR